jgi:hypothetical protein
MAAPAPSFAKSGISPFSRVAPDRRRHKRVPLTSLGRFMRATKQEYPCRLIDISASGAAVSSPVDVELGEQVIALFDQFGGLEGQVTRLFDGGFAYRFSMTQHRREKLVATIMFLMNKHELPGIEGRRHDRIVPTNNVQTLKLGDGIIINCKVIDVSLSGASVETVARPALYANVTLGHLRARVMRHHETGIAVEFIDVQQSNTLKRPLCE